MKKLCYENKLYSSVQAKIWLYTTLIVAIVVGLASYITMNIVERQMVRSVEERSVDADNTIINALTKIMLNHQENIWPQLRNLLSTLPHKNVSVSIADSLGRVVMSSDSTKTGGKIYFKPGQNMDRFQSSDIRILGAAQKIIALRPIRTQARCRTCHKNAGTNLGILEISVSTKHLFQQLSMIRNLVLVNSLSVFLIISLVLGLFFHFLISKPLRRLADSMKNVEDGDLSARVVMQRKDEIGLLNNCFNSMVARLSDMLREVELSYQKELQHADRLSTLGELAAGIAHEIRNPLAAISGAIHVQTMEMAADDPNRKIMEEIQDEVKRLDNSLKSFLAYSRPAKPQFTHVPLDELIEKALTLCARSGQFSGIQLEQKFDQNIPPVYVDPFLMQQVLVNIIINALQAMNHQSQLKVQTALIDTEQDRRVKITISDTGPGIPSDVLDKIFQPFFSTKSQGTGLGLAIANRIVEQHRGKISVQSAPGQGTTFAIEIPLHQ